MRAGRPWAGPGSPPGRSQGATCLGEGRVEAVSSPVSPSVPSVPKAGPSPLPWPQSYSDLLPPTSPVALDSVPPNRPSAPAPTPPQHPLCSAHLSTPSPPKLPSSSSLPHQHQSAQFIPVPKLSPLPPAPLQSSRLPSSPQPAQFPPVPLISSLSLRDPSSPVPPQLPNVPSPPQSLQCPQPGPLPSLSLVAHPGRWRRRGAGPQSPPGGAELGRCWHRGTALHWDPHHSTWGGCQAGPRGGPQRPRCRWQLVTSWVNPTPSPQSPGWS